MNILFLFQRFSFKSSTIYLDLAKACVDAGHNVYVVAGTSDDVIENRIVEEQGCKVAYVKLPDQFKAGKIKKGLVQLMMEPLMMRQIKRLLWNEKIDLIAYPTPPITLAGVVGKTKKHYRAKSYLMLKDIFPQNAVDLKMMSDSSIIFKYFKHVEKKLYQVSDVIGCMSPANIEYMKSNNDSAIFDRLTLFPNTVKIQPEKNNAIRLDDDKIRFILGGNLGKPQAIDFILEGIKRLYEEGFDKAEFLIVGDGTEAGRTESYIKDNSIGNVSYHKQLPRNEYEQLLDQQDVGIISLSPEFTIPNFPSRLLSYMQVGKPVLVVTDRVSDIGSVVTTQAKCGFYTSSDNMDEFIKTVKSICERKNELSILGKNGREYLIKNYNVEKSVNLLEKSVRS